MRVDLLLESALDVVEAHAGERTDALAAPQRQHEMIELADVGELGGKRVHRGRIHRCDLRFRAKLTPCLGKPGFVAPGDGDPRAGCEEMTGGRQTDPR